MQVYTIKTYGCTTCNYKQDFTQGSGEKCPGNTAHGNLVKFASPKKRSIVSVADDSELSAIKVPVYAPDGSVTYRDLTTSELDALKQRRDTALAEAQARADG